MCSCVYGVIYKLIVSGTQYQSCQNFSTFKQYKIKLSIQNICWQQGIVISVIIINCPESHIVALVVNVFISLIIIVCGRKLVLGIVINDHLYCFVSTWPLVSFSSGFLQSEHFPWWLTAVTRISLVFLNLGCTFCGVSHAFLQESLEWWSLGWPFHMAWWYAQTIRHWME